MVYQVLYREWRPQTFADLVGQEHVSRTLQNALQRDQLAHAYLFSGPRGTGKTSVARVLAKAVNCMERPGNEPCNRCRLCQSITTGSAVDVQEIDAASNRGIDEIRELREKVRYYPVECRRKVYIIDEVHMLTEPAFNALLKTLEDPPKHVMFILATTEPHKLPATIISRCQRFDFHRLSQEMIMQRLQIVAEGRGFALTPAGQRAIAQAAEGGMRDALSLLDQCLALGESCIDASHIEELLGKAGEEVYDELCRSLARGDVLRLMDMIEELVLQGRDIRRLAIDWCDYLRDLLLVKLKGGRGEAAGEAARYQRLLTTAAMVSVDYLLGLIKLLVEAEGEIRRTGHARLIMETTLIRALPDNETAATSLPEPEIAMPTGRPGPPKEPPLASPEKGTRVSSGTRREETPSSPEREAAAAGACSAQWEQLMEGLRKARKLSIAACLQPAEPVWDEEGQVVKLVYPRQFSFHKERIETDAECRQALESLGREAFGQTVRFQPCFQGEEPAAGEAPGSSPELNPLVKLALEIFEGEIVEGDL